MRVAVIGAGIAGLTAAHMLRPIHQVTLYEGESRAGGHANTIDVCEGARSLALDTGFIVYNEHTYPGFTRLLAELGVATRPSDMSFSVSCRACRLEYSSAGLRGLLAQPWSALRPQTHALLVDLLRFYGDAARALRTGEADGCSLSQWARDRRYSGSFWRHFLAPLGAAVWSTRPADIGQFPA
ncbi:MAG TPA: NAD(P)-binding protein, partial [Dehalococcoidia bacterium]|nr:NAD(P)-binding protein [Dehalococcoidia bacterium]